MRLSLRILLGSLAVAALAAGCASVLSVDMTYELVDAGAPQVGLEAGADGGVSESGVTTSRVRCAADASTFCDAGTEECCFNASHTLSCVGRGTSDPCPQGTDIVCDDPSDCPNGNVCCIQLDTSNDILGTSCASGACPTGAVELCAPPSGACTAGQCAALNVLPNPPIAPAWFYGCQ